jgi:hypothetical protein
MIFVGFSPFVSADDIYTVTIKKQEQKEKSRWSLADWLDTRDRMRVMDLWLAMHSPTPYEFFIASDYGFVTRSAGGGLNHLSFSAAAYAQIFGLQFQYDAAPRNRWFAQFNLRFFGLHAQATNMTLIAGVRNQSDSAGQTFRNAYLGGSITLYFARFFGVDGQYQYFFTSTPSSTGEVAGGYRLQGGAFIDFKFFRPYAYYFFEDTLANTYQNGFHLGAKIFF